MKLQHTNQGWAEILLHIFLPAGTSDGFEPTDTLTMDRKGNFYGATQMGGGSKNCYDGCGTVYEVIP